MLRLSLRSAHTPLVVAPLAALLALAALAACAEQSEDGSPIVKADTGLSDVAADSGAPDTATAHDSAASETATASGAVVLNEMRASGGDYLEVLNVSSKPVDLSGWQLSALKNDDASSPNVFTFPTGTTIAAGEHLVIVGKVADAGTDPTTACADAAVSHCFNVTWGVSDKAGSTVTLALADAAVSDLQLYPPSAAPSGDSWGRLPDGTGAFAANKPTPGAANAAP